MIWLFTAADSAGEIESVEDVFEGLEDGDDEEEPNRLGKEGKDIFVRMEAQM